MSLPGLTPEDIAELVVSQGSRVRHFLKKRGVRNEGLLDDLVQETYAQALRCCGAYQGNSHPATWLFGIALNLAREHWGKKSTTMYVDVDDEKLEALHDLQAHTEGPLEILLRDERLRRTLAVLGEHAAFMRMIGEGHTYEAVAEHFKIPVGTVRSRANRLRDRLITAEKEADMSNYTPRPDSVADRAHVYLQRVQKEVSADTLAAAIECSPANTLHACLSTGVSMNFFRKRLVGGRALYSLSSLDLPSVNTLQAAKLEEAITPDNSQPEVVPVFVPKVAPAPAPVVGRVNVTPVAPVAAPEPAAPAQPPAPASDAPSEPPGVQAQRITFPLLRDKIAVLYVPTDADGADIELLLAVVPLYLQRLSAIQRG